MKDLLESTTSYVLGLGAAFFSVLFQNTNEIMVLGGIVLLGLRLYVDGVRAVKTWRNKE